MPGLVPLLHSVISWSSLEYFLAGIGFWLAGHFLADLSWFSLVSCSVAKGKWLMGARGYKAILVACGCVLLGFGIFFVYKFAPLLV